MKFEILEKKKSQKCFEISTDKKCLMNLKAQKDNYEYFSINSKDFALDVCLYGQNKKETIEIQKQNAKKITKIFKVCAKAVKILKKHKTFDGCFYVEDLSNKKNNNELLLCAMLDLKFNVSPVKRISAAIGYASDFIDKENEINNMCDFKDNLCVCHRDNKKKGISGCCPSFCKYTKAGVCNQKCLACKIFMCDYLINTKGYYFTAHTIPVLTKHLTFIERFFCFGLLFKTHKQTTNRIWCVRWLEIAFTLLIMFLLVFICI